jgi:hypothetical protein
MKQIELIGPLGFQASHGHLPGSDGQVPVLYHSEVGEAVRGFQEFDKLPQCFPWHCRRVLQ